MMKTDIGRGRWRMAAIPGRAGRRQSPQPRWNCHRRAEPRRSADRVSAGDQQVLPLVVTSNGLRSDDPGAELPNSLISRSCSAMWSPHHRAIWGHRFDDEARRSSSSSRSARATSSSCRFERACAGIHRPLASPARPGFRYRSDVSFPPSQTGSQCQPNRPPDIVACLRERRFRRPQDGRSGPGGWYRISSSATSAATTCWCLIPPATSRR
jgi:hypothetical protein